MDGNSSGEESSGSPPFDDRTRRAFFSATATLGTVVVAGCGAEDVDDVPANGTGTQSPLSPIETTAGPRDTQEPTEEFTETEEETESPTEQTPANPDVSTLNYLLAVEHLERAFYRDSLDQFNDADLRAADGVSDLGDTVQQQVSARLDTIRSHEEQHVNTLQTSVESVQQTGGDGRRTPVEEGEYEFDDDSANDFIETAQDLEETSAAAYAGAARRLNDNDVLTAAAGIYSVEHRHAAYLNFLNRGSPFPNAFVEAQTVNDVQDGLSGYVSGDLDWDAFQTETGQQGDGQNGAGQQRDDQGGTRRTPDRRGDDGTSDANALNRALRIERMEYAFYRDGLDEFSDDELQNADVLSDFNQAVRSSVSDHLRTIRDHESQHVDALSGAIGAMNGQQGGQQDDQQGDQQNGTQTTTPVPEGEYDFGYETPSEFLELARELENTGVAAYNGAATTVANDDVFQSAISIHGVEARHASYLNILTGRSPFPQAIDEPQSESEIEDFADQYVDDGTTSQNN